MINLRKVVNTIYIGIREPIRDTLNYYTSIYHTLNFIFSFIHQSSEKESQSSPPPCSYLFFIRGCHISSFLFFESPVRCPRTKRVHGNVTEREIKASREKIAISRRSDVALYHHGNGPFSFETDVSNLPCRRNFWIRCPR